MPRRPPTVCRHPGCTRLVAASYCEEHAAARKEQAAEDQRKQDQRRGSSAARGYDSRWRKARAGYLRKHPLCRLHQMRGELEPATVVDHIIPHRGDKARFWDSNNWQPLCKRCHDRKTATEDGGFGRAGGGAKTQTP